MAFSEAVDINRSLLYEWDDRLRNENTLQPKKPIAKTHPRKLSKEKMEQVIGMWNTLGKLATEYIVGKLCGISASMAGKIRRSCRPKAVRERINGSSLFLPHVTWAMDIMERKWRGLIVYIMMITEEYSFRKLGWLCRIRKSSSMAIELIKRTGKKAGYRPFSIKKDNESLFASDKVQKTLEEEKIIDVPSPPYWARYNGRMERSFKDLDKGLEINDEMEWSEVKNEVAKTIWLLNKQIPRKKLDGKTCDDVFYSTELPDYDREFLYNEYIRIQDLLPKMKNRKRDIIKNKRLAGEWVLERYGLCKITKGYWKPIQEADSVNQLSLCFVQ